VDPRSSGHGQIYHVAHSLHGDIKLQITPVGQ
jgi:hypothetical protein